MNHRIVWSLAGVLGLGLLIAAVSALPAQRRGEKGAPPLPGRFVVAHATGGRIVVLDSVTGQLYQAGTADFKKLSDLPRVSDTFPSPPRDKDGNFKEKDKDANPKVGFPKDKDK